MRPALRSNLAWGLYGGFIGSGITLATFIMLMHGAIITERRSPHDFDTTVRLISTKRDQSRMEGLQSRGLSGRAGTHGRLEGRARRSD
jgi:hypothetical protein